MKVTALKPNPVPARPPKRRAHFIGLGVVMIVALYAAGLLITRSRPPEPGSKEDLAGRLEALEPPSMQSTNEFYKPAGACEPKLLCPAVTRWYSISGPVGAARDAVIERLRQQGLEFRPNELEPNVIVANDKKDYIYFLVFHEPPLDGPMDRVLPRSVEADFVVIWQDGTSGTEADRDQ